MRALATLLVVAVVVDVAAAPVARADDELAEAERLKAALDYQHALAIVDRLLARGGAAPDRLAQLHLLAGTRAAGLDRPTLAEDHFARLLAIDPRATLPPGTSPKITTPFDAARALTTPLHISARVADASSRSRSAPIRWVSSSGSTSMRWTRAGDTSRSPTVGRRAAARSAGQRGPGAR